MARILCGEVGVWPKNFGAFRIPSLGRQHEGRKSRRSSKLRGCSGRQRILDTGGVAAFNSAPQALLTLAISKGDSMMGRPRALRRIFSAGEGSRNGSHILVHIKQHGQFRLAPKRAMPHNTMPENCWTNLACMLGRREWLRIGENEAKLTVWLYNAGASAAPRNSSQPLF